MKRKAREVVAEVAKKVTRKSPGKEAAESSPSPKKSKQSKTQAPAFIERTPIVSREHSLKQGEHLCSVLCWNVAGLRGTLKNNKSVFDQLVETHNPHIICVQETKIQSTHEAEFNADPNLLPGYEKFWSSSVTKKGYSGTAMFVKRSICGDVTQRSQNDSTGKSISKGQKSISSFFSSSVSKPTKTSTTKNQSDDLAVDSSASSSSQEGDVPLRLKGVRFELDDTRFSGEGRTITAEFDKFFLVNCYVPNSGQTLDRLDFRVSEWDPYLYNYLKGLEEIKPVIFTDIHNPSAKHLVKQAGVTPQERASFSTLLASGFQDAFRYFYPDHEGQFTYWSQRTNARTVNKGLRLDYFLCSHDLFPHEDSDRGDSIENNEECKSDDMKQSLEVLDSTILHRDTLGCSDHCPILLTFKIW